MGRTYATEGEFAAWLNPDPAPSGAARLLRDASEDVDEMLLTAIYRVDEDGLPVDAPVIEALRDATCAQAWHRSEHGDDVEISMSSEAVSLGPLSFGGGGAGKASQGIPQHSPRALRILRNAGLIPGTVQDA